MGRRSCLGFFLSTLLLSYATAAHASKVRAADADDATIGTRPAETETPVSELSAGPAPRREHLYIASDPPGDWAVLHAGLRPHLGIFGGIATFALAHARTERFYGLFSLSGIRNDAGTHVSALQFAFGRSLSDHFIGATQIALGENRARNFYGLAQVSLAYNRTLDMVGLMQASAFNRSKAFIGALQLGGYNRNDVSLIGLMQLGGFNHARGKYAGLLQLGGVNAQGPELVGDYTKGADWFTGIGLASPIFHRDICNSLLCISPAPGGWMRKRPGRLTHRINLSGMFDILKVFLKILPTGHLCSPISFAVLS